MQITVRDEALDYRANPMIMANCKFSIQMCNASVITEFPDIKSTDYGGKIEGA